MTIDWLDELDRQGKAICLASGGYPTAYTAKVEDVRPQVLAGTPAARKFWLCDEGDILTEKREGKTTVNQDQIGRCSPNEWVLIKAWDES